MSYEIRWEEKGTFTCLYGVITIEELEEANGKLHGDARFDNHKYQIWNLLEADFGSITEEEIELVAATDMASSISVPQMKVAIFAVDHHTLKIVNHYIKWSLELNPSWHFKVCTNIEEAEKWAKAVK